MSARAFPDVCMCVGDSVSASSSTDLCLCVVERVTILDVCTSVPQSENISPTMEVLVMICWYLCFVIYFFSHGHSDYVCVNRVYFFNNSGFHDFLETVFFAGLSEPVLGSMC